MRCQGLVSCLGHFSTGETTTGTQWIRGLVGPAACLDGCGKSRPHRFSIPEPPNPQRVAIPTTLTRATDEYGYDLFPHEG